MPKFVVLMRPKDEQSYSSIAIELALLGMPSFSRNVKKDEIREYVVVN
jgi:hypothetical protein